MGATLAGLFTKGGWKHARKSPSSPKPHHALLCQAIHIEGQSSGTASLNDKSPLNREMGCGASKESTHLEPQPASTKKQITAPVDGECSQLRQNFDCDPEDESASKATKAVNLIARACSPSTCEPEQDVEQHDEEEDDCGKTDAEQEQEDDSKAQRGEDDSGSGATAAARNSSLAEDDEDDDDDDDSGWDGLAAVAGNEVLKRIELDEERAAEAPSSDEKLDNLEHILSPAEFPSARSNRASQCGRDHEQRGVDDILPKAAKAALEAIVKSAEEDIQAHKVAAAMAAVGEILFGDKEMKKPETIVEVAEGREQAARTREEECALNGEVETNAFPPSGQDEDCSNDYSPKSSFLFDYCQKLRLNGYKVSSPPSTTSGSSEGDTISFIQDFLEEIDLTKELSHDPGTPRILFNDFNNSASKTQPLSFTEG